MTRSELMIAQSLAVAIAMLAACKQPAAPATDTAKPATARRSRRRLRRRREPASAQVRTTKDVPTLTLATVDGKQFDLAAHRGKWVVVNFWATWCGPCLKEMPALSALDTMREHIDVVGLAYEDTTPAEMQAFLKKHPGVVSDRDGRRVRPAEGFRNARGLADDLSHRARRQGRQAFRRSGGTAATSKPPSPPNGGPQPAEGRVR